MGLLAAALLLAAQIVPAPAAGWSAGVARVDITPAQPLWLAGYASREHEAEGALHPLWVKALALQDAAGNRALIVTSDHLGFPKPVSDRIFDRLQASTGLDRAAIVLNSSHTHSGPVIDGSLMCIYPMDAAAAEKVRAYTADLENKVVAAAEAALGQMTPARLEHANGVTRFGVNRRNNKEAELATTHDLNGPIDHAVPVLRVLRESGGEPLALLFGYACHGTVLCTYQWCGDYMGFAQEALENALPGTTALFFAGCGADINPLPRRTVSLARQYGAELAAAVQCAIAEPMKPLSPELATRRNEVELFLEPPLDRPALVKISETGAPHNRRAALDMIALLDAGQPLRTSYLYPVQVWNLGGLPLVALGGEVVVDYAIIAKQMLGPDTFVMGFSNDLMSYIPSARVLAEGGYEGGDSQLEYGMPAKWRADIEQRLVECIGQTAETAGFSITKGAPNEQK